MPGAQLVDTRSEFDLLQRGNQRVLNRTGAGSEHWIELSCVKSCQEQTVAVIWSTLSI